VAARVDGSASFVAARRLNRLLEPLTNSSSAARSVTRSSEAMSFSERARVAVFATVAFDVCVAFAIFVFPFLSGGRHRTPITARTDQGTTAVIAPRLNVGKDRPVLAPMLVRVRREAGNYLGGPAIIVVKATEHRERDHVPAERLGW